MDSSSLKTWSWITALGIWFLPPLGSIGQFIIASKTKKNRE